MVSCSDWDTLEIENAALSSLGRCLASKSPLRRDGSFPHSWFSKTVGSTGPLV